MMLRAAVKLASRSPAMLLSPPTSISLARFCAADSAASSQQQNIARQMVQYALSHARSQRSGESYAQAMLVLEQGATNLQAEENESVEDALGMILLAMSTLLYERGELQDAMQKLQMANQLRRASSSLRVAAWEGLVGLNLEVGEDITSSVLADDCYQLLRSWSEDGLAVTKATNSRAKSIKGLVNFVIGDYKSGNVALSVGEFFHASGNFSMAREFYEKVLQVAEKTDISDSSCIAAANMVPEEVLVGATCALGQLLSHSGNFNEAEELLTSALTKAESHFGSSHPKVAVVLTCIALMYGHKARVEASSSLLIQEGLYRKALDLLKAPSVESDVEDVQLRRRDIVALARGGYGEILSVQENRKGEGEQMRNWANAAWRNRRLSLAQALEFSDPSKAAVIDTRISRVL